MRGGGKSGPVRCAGGLGGKAGVECGRGNGTWWGRGVKGGPETAPGEVIGG